jgi:hypothetical protein
MMRRLFRLALGASLTKAWSQKSRKWLSVAGALVAFRMFERLSARALRRPSKGKGA